MCDKPLLAIIIPTRNRFNYIKSAIESVLDIESTDIQLVIADNSDHNELEVWLRENVEDLRLVYHYSKQQMSMCENYEHAVALASGEFICLIGDDDGVNPEIVVATRWAKAHNVDALVSSSVINYVWPDLQMLSHGAMGAGTLSIRSFTGQVTFPDPRVEMFKCARDAGQNFHKLPKAYYGVVKKSSLELIKTRSGLYFPGVSPDMSIAIAIASVVNNVCHVDYPLFVPGSSAKSNAGLSGLKKHIGRLRDQPHLPANCESEWSTIVPLFYSVPTIWAEATVNALNAMGQAEILRNFNVSLLYAICSVFHLKYMRGNLRRFFRALYKLKQGYVTGVVLYIYWYFYWWFLRFKSFFSRYVHNNTAANCIYEVKTDNIREAVNATYMYLRRSPINCKNIFE